MWFGPMLTVEPSRVKTGLFGQAGLFGQKACRAGSRRVTINATSRLPGWRCIDHMATRDEIADALAGMTLFADLTTPQLLGVASRFEEAFFPEGARVLRQGLSGSAFYVILDGDAAIVVDGQQRAVLGRGEFFGEVSLLLGEPPTADVVALRPLRCIMLPGSSIEAFLIEHPRVTYRMLQAESRRLRNANRARN